MVRPVRLRVYPIKRMPLTPAKCIDSAAIVTLLEMGATLLCYS